MWSFDFQFEKSNFARELFFSPRATAKLFAFSLGRMKTGAKDDANKRLTAAIFRVSTLPTIGRMWGTRAARTLQVASNLERQHATDSMS